MKMKSGTIYEFLQKSEFWAGHRLSLAEAEALSALAASAQPGAGAQPPAKPPAPSTPVARADSMPEPVVSGEVATAPARSPGAVASGSPPQDVAGRAAVIEQMTRAAPEPAQGRSAARVSASAGTRAPDAVSAGAPIPEASSAGARSAPPAASAGGARAANPDIRPALLEIEGEALVRAGAFQVAGGQVRVQPMTSFGAGWSGGEQLFWSGGAVGAVLDLIVDVPAASQYAVEIYMTRAPDYGRVSFEIDGKPGAYVFDGMNVQVLATGPQQLGKFPLQAGQRRVSLMIVGKYKDSTGYYVGIDKLRLYPAGPID